MLTKIAFWPPRCVLIRAWTVKASGDPAPRTVTGGAKSAAECKGEAMRGNAPLKGPVRLCEALCALSGTYLPPFRILWPSTALLAALVPVLGRSRTDPCT
jgi:hypothetical protein